MVLIFTNKKLLHREGFACEEFAYRAVPGCENTSAPYQIEKKIYLYIYIFTHTESRGGQAQAVGEKIPKISRKIMSNSPRISSCLWWVWLCTGF